MRLISIPSIGAMLLLAPATVAMGQEPPVLRPVINSADVETEETDLLPLRRSPAEEDPYAPLGIRVGSFILYPSLTTSLGYYSNADGAAGGAPGTSVIITPEILIQSDFARHAATLRLRGDYEQFTDGSDGTPTALVDGTARLDLPNEWTSDFAASYAYSQQSLADPSFPAGSDVPPGVHELNSSAALNGHFGRATFTVEGSADRTIYEDATSLGVPVDQGDRLNTLFGGRLRVGYDSGGIITPFVEGEVARRSYDRSIDNNGLRRSSTELGWRVGLAVDRGPALTGEIAVGAAHADFDDPSLATLRALTVDGSLVWQPTELTSVTFEAGTDLRPATNPVSSGSVAYTCAVDVEYAWRQNVALNLTGDVTHETTQGTGERAVAYSAGVAATWKLNRNIQLRAGYVHEWLDSTDDARDYQSDAVRVELKVQR